MRNLLLLVGWMVAAIGLLIDGSLHAKETIRYAENSAPAIRAINPSDLPPSAALHPPGSTLDPECRGRDEMVHKLDVTGAQSPAWQGKLLGEEVEHNGRDLNMATVYANTRTGVWALVIPPLWPGEAIPDVGKLCIIAEGTGWHRTVDGWRGEGIGHSGPYIMRADGGAWGIVHVEEVSVTLGRESRFTKEGEER